MSSSSNSLPQEWPEYLNDEAEIVPARTVPPPGRYVLDFSALQPVGFEQFCWWLLRKEHRLEGCKRLGGNGHSQDGIDLFAFDRESPERLLVFECKSGQKFSARNLTDAVERFVQGSWKSSTREFCLILAKAELDPPLTKRWREEKERLKEAGIDAAIWTAHTLTAKVEGHPDILSKFFPTHRLEYFGNKWMERVSFHEALSKAFFDPREDVSSRARALASQTHAGDAMQPVLIGEGNRKFNQYGHNWAYEGPWFSLNAILPGVQFNGPSAAINFKIPELSGMTIALGSRWLLDSMLFDSGAPAASKYRRFVVGPFEKRRGQVVDLSACRLTLGNEVVSELAAVADALTTAVKEAFLTLEAKWGAAGFPFVAYAGNKVAIGAVREGVWREIMNFANAHDVAAGEGPWNMFDAASNVLKPYVTRAERHGGRFEAGYHGIFYAAGDVDVTLEQREVAILWQPNELSSDGEMSSRAWWPCDYAFKWLNEELLPEVRRWVFRREYGSMLKRLIRYREAGRFERHLDEIVILRDLRQLPLLQDGGLHFPVRQAVEQLQYFFVSANGQPDHFLQLQDVEALYRALALLSRERRGYVGYVCGNLSLDESPTSHVELEMSIIRHVEAGKVVANSAVIDCALRAMLELMGRDHEPIPETVDEVLRDVLTPFARVYDEAILVSRHTKVS